jgi:hypothetical protein
MPNQVVLTVSTVIRPGRRALVFFQVQDDLLPPRSSPAISVSIAEGTEELSETIAAWIDARVCAAVPAPLRGLQGCLEL